MASIAVSKTSDQGSTPCPPVIIFCGGSLNWKNSGTQSGQTIEKPKTLVRFQPSPFTQDKLIR